MLSSQSFVFRRRQACELALTRPELERYKSYCPSIAMEAKTGLITEAVYYIRVPRLLGLTLYLQPGERPQIVFLLKQPESLEIV